MASNGSTIKRFTRSERSARPAGSEPATRCLEDISGGCLEVSWRRSVSGGSPRSSPDTASIYVVRMDENNINYELLGTRYRYFSRTATT
jgi:hypothetical protein